MVRPGLATMEDPRVARWYALSMRSRFEKKAHSQLIEKRVDAYLPLIEEVHVWSDRKKKVLEPLFRGYLFVRTDLRNRIEILQTDGVVRFVGIGHRPSPIPEVEMDWVKLAAREPSRLRRESFLTPGERVRVNAGPLQGIEGVIVQIKGSCRLVVAVECISQAFSVDVAPEVVEKIQMRRDLASAVVAG
jgi:transcription antitermination factor NusG